MTNRTLIWFVLALQAIALIGIGRLLFEPKVIRVSERGWIGCENGTMWAKNIDIAADTFKLPEGRYLFDLDGRYCKEQGGGTLG